MQRERRALDSFPEPIDLNQGSHPENSSIANSATWDSMMNPVETRLPRDMVASSEGNVSQMDVASDYAQRFSGWDSGESSSRTNNIPEEDLSDVRLGWSPFPALSGYDSRLQDSSPEPNTVSSTRSIVLENYSANNRAFLREYEPHGSLGPSLPPNVFKSIHPDSGHTSNFCAGSSDLGGYSGTPTAYPETSDCPGSSFSTWGSSCKRKALEGSSGQFYSGGCSSSNPPMEKNLMQDLIPGRGVGPGNSSSGQLNLSLTSQSVHLSPSSEFGLSGLGPSFLPSSNVARIAEGSGRSSVPVSSRGHHNSISFPFDVPREASMGSYGIRMAPPSNHISNSAGLDSRSTSASLTNLNNSVNQSILMRMDEARVSQCAGALGPRAGSLSASFAGDTRSVAHGEVAIRSSRRANPVYAVTVSAPEAGIAVQDHVDWSFTSRTSSTRSHSSGSRAGPLSRARSSALWLPPPVHTSQNHHRLSEAAPWNPHPGVESGGRRSNHSPFNPPSISSGDGASSSRAQIQPDYRSATSSLDMPRDEINGWRAFSAASRRHRLIRQVLNAMRRGAYLQTEDLMLIDPFLSGFAEFHDRHHDMRLDVDNMSYEELLALEERIGNVSTGLSEEKIERNMKRRKQEATQALHNWEPCCICQEDYIHGDDIGMLDCGHEFHTECIKQWLMLKNLCPICKMAALQS